MHDVIENRAITAVLKPFMMERAYRGKVERCFTTLVRRVIFIQRRFRNMQMMNEAKYKVLNAIWIKELGEIQSFAARKKSKDLIEFVAALK